jgi:hypothetical protein
MRIFYETYPTLLQHEIGSSTTNQFENMQKDILSAKLHTSFSADIKN